MMCDFGFFCAAYWLVDIGRSAVTASAEPHRLTAGRSASVQRFAAVFAEAKSAV